MKSKLLTDLRGAVYGAYIASEMCGETCEGMQGLMDLMVNCGEADDCAWKKYMAVEEADTEEKVSKHRFVDILPLLFHLAAHYGYELENSDSAMREICRISGYLRENKAPLEETESVIYLNALSRIMVGYNKKQAVKEAVSNTLWWYRYQNISPVILKAQNHYFREKEKIYARRGVCTPLVVKAFHHFIEADSYMDCLEHVIDGEEDAVLLVGVVGGMAGLFWGYDALPKAEVELIDEKYPTLKESCVRYADHVRDVWQRYHGISEKNRFEAECLPGERQEDYKKRSLKILSSKIEHAFIESRLEHGDIMCSVRDIGLVLDKLEQMKWPREKEVGISLIDRMPERWELSAVISALLAEQWKPKLKIGHQEYRKALSNCMQKVNDSHKEEFVWEAVIDALYAD